jgi:spore coat polysaccharide biosynthesis protein SpsF
MKVAALVPVSFSDTGTCLALHDLAGKPLIGHVMDRLARVSRLEYVLVVTSNAPADDPIANFCQARGAQSFRSDKPDELGRVLAALKATETKAAALIRPSAPLIDPGVVDQVVNLVEMTDGMLDYVGTDLSQTYPRGMEVEGFTRAALEDADHRCLDAAERASAALYLKRNSRLYRLLAVTAPEALARPDLNLAVATDADLPRLESMIRRGLTAGDLSLAELILAADTAPPA